MPRKLSASPWVALTVWAALLTPAHPVAQGTGTESGTITDQSGAVVPAATILLLNERTADRLETTSDEHGHYAFGPVFAGTYTIRVTREGFKTSEHTGLVIGSGDALELDLTLALGKQTETVVVEGNAQPWLPTRARLNTA